MRYTKLEKQRVINHIKQVIKEKGVRSFGNVTKVSKSGMTRYIKIYTIVDNDLINLSYHTAVLLDLAYDDNKGVKVKGVGSDMIFHTIYNLNGALAVYDGVTLKESPRACYDYLLNSNYKRI